MEHKNKKFVQQIFHPGLFLPDQNTSSTTMETNESDADNIPEKVTNSKSTMKPNEWSEVSRKRARTSPGSTSKDKQPKTSNWLRSTEPEVITQNSFDGLDDEVIEIRDQKDKKTPKPPPIYVSNVGNINPLTTLLNNIAKNDYVIKVINSEEVKIQPKSSEAYTNIVKHLDEKETDFHTYKPKQERSFKVVLKNLHYSTPLEDIEDELKSIGHVTTNVWNVKHRVTKKPLPMFNIDLKPAPNNAQIYKIETLLHCRVKFEPPHHKREIPQCSNCQRYGHTKSFCHHKARCVKCAGSHPTIQCPRKERSNDVKCVLCDGNHPANYKGCGVYKELQKISFPSLRKPRQDNANGLSQQNLNPQAGTTHQQTSKPTEAAGPSKASSDTTNRTYSDTVKGKAKNSAEGSASHHPNINSQSSDMQELKQMMKNLMDKMGTMLNLLSTIVSQWANK